MEVSNHFEHIWFENKYYSNPFLIEDIIIQKVNKDILANKYFFFKIPTTKSS